MTILDGIEVQIASRTTGKALAEYDKPDVLSSADNLSIEKFVKAETGLEFHVEVFVKSSFNFYQASGIQIWVNIDADRIQTCYYWSKPEVLEQQTKRKPIVIGHKSYKEGAQYYRAKFKFSSLKISE